MIIFIFRNNNEVVEQRKSKTEVFTKTKFPESSSEHNKDEDNNDLTHESNKLNTNGMIIIM